MKYLVPLILLFFTIAFWLAVDQNANLGKTPADEEVIHTQERNKVSGELLNVEIVRCRICGQVLSYIQSNLRGKVVQASVYSHHCGRYGSNSFVRYNGSAIGPLRFNVFDWLDLWQRRLRIKR